MWPIKPPLLICALGSSEPPLEAETFGGGIMLIRRSVCEISSVIATNVDAADLGFAIVDINQIYCTISLC